jgi:hypothetical protein
LFTTTEISGTTDLDASFEAYVGLLQSLTFLSKSYADESHLIKTNFDKPQVHTSQGKGVIMPHAKCKYHGKPYLIVYISPHLSSVFPLDTSNFSLRITYHQTQLISPFVSSLDTYTLHE